MTFDYAGPFRSVRLRLLPWKPRLHKPPWDWDAASGIPDPGDDVLGWVVFGVAVVLLLPVVLVLLLFSAEILIVVALVPFVMSGQLLGLLPWQLALRSMSDEKRYVSVRGTRQMLEARRHYRALVR